VVKDTNDCVGNYINNPVVIQNISGVEITTELVTPENDFSSDGSIFLEAIVSSGDINYSIYNGSNPQTNNGLFEGLSAGNYNCKVWDNFGCDTTFEVIVPRNTTTILEAISGFGSSCVNDSAVSSLNLEQFNGVFSFEAKIYYDINVVNCVGYIDLLPELQAGFNANITTPGEVLLTWQGISPLSLPDTVMTKLVFGGLGEGVSLIYWEAGPGESVFFNQSIDTINAVCHVGEVHIYSRPEIDLQSSEYACAGDTISIVSIVDEGNGTIIYSWTGPNGYQSQNKVLLLSPANINQTGTYTLTVVDSMYCHESQSININVIPSPEIAFSPYDTLWAEPGFILEAGYGAEYYYWNTGETTENIVIDSMGNYTVEVTSYENCKSTDAIQILWAGTPFYLPNAFTPNGDGLNDSFGVIPRYDYISKYHLSIYNRWGQRIYETTDINKGWDGTYKGSPCMLGAYVYHIVYEEFGQQPMESKVEKGTVMLVR
jgi:gliding motility-associated-like protein